MTITTRNNGFQAAVHHQNKRFRRQFDSRDEAVRWEAETRLALLNGREPVMPTITPDPELPSTLSDLIEYTYRTEWVHCKSGKGLYQNALMVSTILGPETCVRDVTKVDIDDLIQTLRDHGNKAATINRKLAALSKVFNTAESLGVISTKPKFKTLREPAHRLRWYTKTELGLLNQAAQELGFVRMAQFMRFLADTGLRLSEALSLTHDDIVEDLILVRDSKNSTARSVPMTPAVREILGDTRNAHPTHPWGMLTKHSLRVQWDLIKRRCGLANDEAAVIHTFRHTFISRLVQANVPILTVQKLAGHKTIEMTLRYAHLAPQNLTDAIARLS
jgi:integrase